MKGSVRTALGVLLSLVLLWWALRDVSPEEVLQQIRSADGILLAFAIVIALATFWIRAFRWGIFLKPVVGPTPLQARVGATFIGFTFNNLLPARIGEFARAYSLSRVTGVPVAASFATLVVERLLDGLVLLGLLFAAMGSAEFPGTSDARIRSGAMIVALGMVPAIVGLGVAVANPRGAVAFARTVLRPLPDRMGTAVLRIARSFGQGLTILRTPRLFFLAAGLTVFQWSLAALSYLLAFRAFQIDRVPYSGAVFLQSLMSFAAAPPSSPGFFGPFEAAARFGLSLWGVPDQQSVSFAIGYHIAGFIPVNLIGAYYIWRLGLSWSGLRTSEAKVEAYEPVSTVEPGGSGVVSGDPR